MAEPLHNSDRVARWMSGRWPAGLTASVLAAGFSAGVMLILWKWRWPADHPFEFVVHVSAGLCLGWSLLAHALFRSRPRGLAGLAGPDVLAALHAVQLVLSLIVSIVMLYLAMTALLMRIPSLPFFSLRSAWQVHIWPTGTLDAALVAIAALLAWWRTGKGTIMTGLLCLLVLMSFWSALQIPAAITLEEHGIAQPVLVDWVSPFVFGAALSLAGFTTIAGVLAHRRRVDAWPDSLDDLLSPPPSWPGFQYSAGLIAVLVLVLGCMFIVSPFTPPAAFLAGGSVIVLAARRWNENYADAGLGLITLGILSLLMAGGPDVRGSKAEYFAAVFSRALIGLAVMTAFWHWLAEVWRQQLDGGRAWTTAGRLIRPCQRLGFLLGTIGVLVSYQLAFWPKLPNVYSPDNTPSRWVWGLGAHLLLLGALAWCARRTGKATLAWLSACSAASTAAFIIIRSAGTIIHSGFIAGWPIWLAVAACGLTLWTRSLCRSANWRPFYEPVFLLAVVILPVAAVIGATLIPSRVLPTWIAAATFAVLAGNYLLGALLTGPRRLLSLTCLCVAAGLWNLWM